MCQTRLKLSCEVVECKPLVSGLVIDDHTKIPDMLAQQLVSPVKWEDTMKHLIADGRDELYELGPKNQIKSMTKRINQAGAYTRPLFSSM